MDPPCRPSIAFEPAALIHSPRRVLLRSRVLARQQLVFDGPLIARPSSLSKDPDGARLHGVPQAARPLDVVAGVPVCRRVLMLSRNLCFPVGVHGVFGTGLGDRFCPGKSVVSEWGEMMLAKCLASVKAFGCARRYLFQGS